MKKAWIFYSILIILLLLFLIFRFTNLRYYNPISKGLPGWSDSLEESKRRGVFLGKFVTPTNPVQIDDSIKIFVEEAWIEQMWQYGKFRNQTSKHGTHKQILVKVNPEDLRGYNKEWIISKNIELNRGFGYSNGILMLKYITNYSINPKIEWPIRRLDTAQELPIYYPLDTIGKFILEFKKVDQN